MIYKVVSVLCDNKGKSYSIAYSELQFIASKWQCSNFSKNEQAFDSDWQNSLSGVKDISFIDGSTLNKKFGSYISEAINAFITQNKLEFRVQLIAFSGIQIFNSAENYFELGDPAIVAAKTGINTVSNFPALDISFGGTGRFNDSTATELLAGEAPEIQLALMAVLRWREENNYSSTRTGASKNSIGGAVWLGQEA
jgi:anhydro-N-acetylmuramic acid kinase